MDATLGNIEARFADMIWSNAPIASSAVVKLAEEELGWKKSTTYTVLKRLSEKGLFKNDNGTVIALTTREEYYAKQSEQFVEDAFDGSLPMFLAAFTSRKRLSEEDIAELKKMIDEA